MITLCLEEQTGWGRGRWTQKLSFWPTSFWLVYVLWPFSKASVVFCFDLAWWLKALLYIIIFDSYDSDIHPPIVSSDLLVSECTEICLKCHKGMPITHSYQLVQINNVSRVQYLKQKWQAALIRVFTMKKGFWVRFNAWFLITESVC